MTEAALAVGAELSNWGELRVGLASGNGSTRVMIGDPGLPQGDFALGAVFAEFAYDRLDSAYFPRHGQAFRMSWRGERDALGSRTNGARLIFLSAKDAKGRDEETFEE